MEIIDYQPALPGSWYVAEFGIYFASWGMTFHRWKLRQSNKGTYWVMAPTYCVEEGSEKKWQPYIDFNEEKKRDFNKQVLEALKPFLRPLVV